MDSKQSKIHDIIQSKCFFMAYDSRGYFERLNKYAIRIFFVKEFKIFSNKLWVTTFSCTWSDFFGSDNKIQNSVFGFSFALIFLYRSAKNAAIFSHFEDQHFFDRNMYLFSNRECCRLKRRIATIHSIHIALSDSDLSLLLFQLKNKYFIGIAIALNE